MRARAVSPARVNHRRAIVFLLAVAAGAAVLEYLVRLSGGVFRRPGDTGFHLESVSPLVENPSLVS
jgi:hypothetical protein